MNDRFKYQAWDGKEWHYKNIFLSSDGVLWLRKADKSLVKVDWKVSFCTGLKDKNGKLIYENPELLN